jgi:hypothetical protein
LLSLLHRLRMRRRFLKRVHKLSIPSLGADQVRSGGCQRPPFLFHIRVDPPNQPFPLDFCFQPFGVGVDLGVRRLNSVANTRTLGLPRSQSKDGQRFCSPSPMLGGNRNASRQRPTVEGLVVLWRNKRGQTNTREVD